MESNFENNVPPVQDQKAELDQLANRWMETKKKIGEMRELQLQIEERISALVGVKEEGSITQKTSNWRVSTTGGLTRSLELHDPEYYRSRLGERFDDLINTKLSIKTAEFRRASADEQKVLMEHMIIKPRKIAVRIESKEDR